MHIKMHVSVEKSILSLPIGFNGPLKDSKYILYYVTLRCFGCFKSVLLLNSLTSSSVWKIKTDLWTIPYVVSHS